MLVNTKRFPKQTAHSTRTSAKTPNRSLWYVHSCLGKTCHSIYVRGPTFNSQRSASFSDMGLPKFSLHDIMGKIYGAKAAQMASWVLLNCVRSADVGLAFCMRNSQGLRQYLEFGSCGDPNAGGICCGDVKKSRDVGGLGTWPNCGTCTHSWFQPRKAVCVFLFRFVHS